MGHQGGGRLAVSGSFVRETPNESRQVQRWNKEKLSNVTHKGRGEQGTRVLEERREGRRVSI